MLVACVNGDIFLPKMGQEYWELGERKKCQLASESSPSSGKNADLLLCGEKATLAWQQTWLREDIRKSIYDLAHQEMVCFHSGGNGGGRVTPRWWACTRVIDGIDCR